MFFVPFALIQAPLALLGHRAYCRSVNCYHAGRTSGEAKLFALSCFLAWGLGLFLQVLAWRWDGRFVGSLATGMFVSNLLLVWKTIGITGQICSGKTTLSDMLHKSGIPVIKADEVVKEVLQKPNIIRALRSEFGSDLLNDEGFLDHEKMSIAIEAAEDGLSRHQKIVLPAVIKTMAIRLVKHKLAAWFRGRPMVAIDAPLLHESKLSHLCGPVICVDVTEDIQKQRLEQRGLASDGRHKGEMDERKKKRARMLADNQLSISEKKGKSDVIIPNTGTLEEFFFLIRRYFIYTENMAFCDPKK